MWRRPSFHRSFEYKAISANGLTSIIFSLITTKSISLTCKDTLTLYPISGNRVQSNHSIGSSKKYNSLPLFRNKANPKVDSLSIRVSIGRNKGHSLIPLPLLKQIKDMIQGHLIKRRVSVEWNRMKHLKLLILVVRYLIIKIIKYKLCSL